ncbi:DUF4123 domain-containing protein [Pseudomonas sp. FW306-02-F02-AA]|uniref:DUF4123 domain-containing protein n=1 Tax=Pseudomonas fluorescens TaxID=294 RepID=A0A0N9WB12_PSEFL|nr:MULTISPECIES: DUF4123 domain-containing protein [Pseudomonas]ALI01265.1 hypothetical protein AO353_09360 [Pseudomonas fluorescens]PMZ01891.1 DUF4123 domain-containing protein [Pseudomonas sp. FW306-02-F02-AB]PMZ07693.1 DUF4123 domain-containing protein [Pseudomonas sp. FW306-02-H06C]PMZ13540.1 DUF4123 domain-containing protein [Pseudomonas sp. FW306-02-F02-AA]PMZ19661.1 DUF4123 domain-containing protein [Pseudomonas sp. FW306-02-F08-AA]
MYASNAQWHDQLWADAEQLGHNHLDLLIDATSLDYPLLEELASLPDAPKLAKLFDNTPEVAIADFGPLLLRVDKVQKPWLKTFINAIDCNQHVLALFSPWDFDVLSEHLRGCTQAQWNQGRSEGVLRYYEPRMFVPVCETLTPAQSQAFHAPAIAWHWLDRDQQTQSLPGNYVRHTPPPATKMIVFDHPQVANLLAWTEADTYRIDRCAMPQDYGMSRKEGLIRHLFHSQLAANQKGLKEPEQRQPFIEQWLRDNSPFVIDEPPRPLI